MLALSIGAFDEPFRSRVLTYRASVNYLASEIRVRALPEEPTATVSVNGTVVPAGGWSAPIALAEGGNDVTVAVTAEDGATRQTYSVQVVRQAAQAFAQRAYAKASNAGSGDRLASSIALDGDTLVVGAVGEGSNGTGINTGAGADDSASFSGAVYVFTRLDGTWREQAYIKAFNAGELDQFGASVSLDGDTLVVGRPVRAATARASTAVPSRMTLPRPPVPCTCSLEAMPRGASKRISRPPIPGPVTDSGLVSRWTATCWPSGPPENPVVAPASTAPTRGTTQWAAPAPPMYSLAAAAPGANRPTSKPPIRGSLTSSA